MAKRRANGEGSIRKRSDGRWEGRYTAGYDPETGKRIVKSVLGKTQAEVKEKLRKALEETRELDIVRSDDYTVGEWVQTWFELYSQCPPFHGSVLPAIHRLPRHSIHRTHQTEQVDCQGHSKTL